MKRTPNLIAIGLTAAALTVQWTSQARAFLNSYTYVSTSGNDGNDCRNVATPCRSLTGAFAQTNEGGNIQCLDSGNYGGTIIRIAVTIDCLASGGSANFSQVAIAAPGKTVVLRNMTIDGFNYSNFIPLEIRSAANVYIENVLVTGFPFGTPAIRDIRAGPCKLVIRNSSIVDNAGGGILVAPVSGEISVQLDNVHANYNNYGLSVGRGGRVMIKNSVLTGNGIGIGADPVAVVSVSSSEVSFNTIGIAASPSARVLLSNSSISSNSTAISGATQSTGDNRILANSDNGAAPTIIGGQ